jgi:chorismate mutase
MQVAKEIAEYKQKNGLPILDEERERMMIEANSASIEDESLKRYYVEFLKNNITISKQYQAQLSEQNKDEN